MTIDFYKLIKMCEGFSEEERTSLIVEKTHYILDVFKRKSDNPAISPNNALAAFVIGAAASGGVISDRRYQRIHPYLVKAFGDNVDLNSIRAFFLKSESGERQLRQYTIDLMKIIGDADEKLEYDIVMLLLLIMSVNGKITLRERKYLRQLQFRDINY